ncbi:hypothetical protein ACFW16_30855 [Inquilinus sp. NPDC058860]|uniref:hypothetical protein n=1 Tax=Inquilinus sp. NPDC058860 TaxID=3346652 RepID=UPI003692F040
MVPDWLVGVWRRRLIAFPDGREDRSTAVFWLQTRSAFADIRLPQESLALPRLPRSALPAEALPILARQDGFAGHTTLDGDLCTWHRWISYRPPGPTPDAGRLRLEAGLLIEEGVHAAYREDWERLDDGADGTMAFEGDGGPPRLLVRVGSHFIRIEAPDSVSDGPGCVIDYGRVAAAGEWRIVLSTEPDRTGSSFGPQPDGEGAVESGTGLRWTPL